MKSLLGAVVLVGLATLSSSALAADNDGAKLFTAHCNVCHAEGNNAVVKEKTLKADALKAAGLVGQAEIVKYVSNGKGMMPAFKEKLKPAEIEAIAAYIMEQSAKDWK